VRIPYSTLDHPSATLFTFSSLKFSPSQSLALSLAIAGKHYCTPLLDWLLSNRRRGSAVRKQWRRERSIAHTQHCYSQPGDARTHRHTHTFTTIHKARL